MKRKEMLKEVERSWEWHPASSIVPGLWHPQNILRGKRSIWQMDPEHIIKSAVRPRREGEPKESPKYTIRVPYVSGLSEDLRRICRRYDIRTVLTTTSTLRQQFTRVKDVDPLLSRAGVVYKIPCSCGKRYIGETK